MKKIFNLEKKLNASALAFVVAMSAASYSHAHEGSMLNGTYVGLDAVYNWMGFKKDYGQNIFKKRTPGLNVFVGHMFHENFGAELGFEWDKKMKRDVTVNAGEKVAGIYIDPALVRYQSFKTTVKQRHPYLGLVAKTNVFGDDNFVSLMLGASLSHVEAKYNYFANNIGSVNITRTFSKTKLIALMKATFEHKFNHQFGLKVLADWKNTSQFKMKAKEAGANPDGQVKLKDTFGFGLGVTYYI